MTPGQDIVLKLGRYVQGEGITSGVKSRIDLGKRNEFRNQKARRMKGTDDVLRKRRAVFIDHGDGGVAQLGRMAGGGVIDAE